MTLSSQNTISSKKDLKHRKVLMIAYFFPPSREVGAFRTSKFAKFLPEQGYKPVVLTIKEGNPEGSSLDEPLLGELPQDTRIIRTHTLEPKSLIRFLTWVGAYRLVRFLPFLDPTIQASWIVPTVLTGLREIRRETIDVVYSSSSPQSAHLGALVLSKLSRKPWVADFRDPWTGNELFYAPTRFHVALARFLEWNILKTASKIIVNTPGNKLDLIAQFPAIEPAKVVVIPNGFDRDDFSITPHRRDKFTIVYTGTFYDETEPTETYPSVKKRIKRYIRDNCLKLMPTSRTKGLHSPFCFLQAVRLLLDEKPELKNDFQIVFVGPLGSGARKIIGELELESIVKPIGPVPHSEAIRNMMESDVLLLVLGSMRKRSSWVPAKTYEYLAAERAILALVPDGDARDLILDAGAGIVIEPDNVPDIKKAIEKLYYQSRIEGKAIFPNRDFICRFERRHLTKALASEFDSVLDEA